MATAKKKQSKKEQQSVPKQWYVIDAKDQVLGRLASRIAIMLMGKHKAAYTPQWDQGDHIVVINAIGIKLTGEKRLTKKYKQYSGYPGGLKEVPLLKKQQINFAYPLRHAVKGMLPKSNLAHKMIKKLYIYKDNNHPHEAQKPQEFKLA